MYLPSDYDNHGQLKTPALLWGVLLLQARTWVLFVLAGASRQQGEALLNLFYPDRDAFWLGLIPGIPAVLAFLISGRRRQFPHLWQRWHWVLIAAQLMILLWQIMGILQTDRPGGIALALLVADGVALVWLLTHRRLRDSFAPAED